MNQRLKFILMYAKPHKFKFALLLVCIIVTTLSGSVYPFVFGRLVDEVFYHKNMSVFLSIVALYGVVYLFNQIMHFVLNMSWAALMTHFLFDIRTEIFKKVLSYKGEKLSSIYSGDIISRMDRDTNEFMNFIHWNIFYSIGGILNLLLAFGFIFYFNLWIGIFTVALTPVIVYSSRHFSKKAKEFYGDIAKQNGLLSSWLFEIIKGMQDIKLLGASKNILSEYVGKTVKIMRLQINSNKIELLSDRVNSGISLLAQMILYTISAIFIATGHLTIGGFTACVSYFGTCISTFNVLNSKILNISKNMVSIERVMDVLVKDSENYNTQSSNNKIAHGGITFSDVWFSYGNGIDVLKGVSMEITPGEKISLVGQSGAGKSTIANLIYKLYEVSQGEIRIDGIHINDFNLHSLREQIGIVHQDSVIFDGTIRFNLTFSNDTSNDESLWQALKMAHLYDFVQSLPNGLDTNIGPGGTGFSGGQEQRLSIARIFVKNPKILIFDEATSSLDSEAESVIRSAWGELCNNRTIIIIAHRLSTILGSDRIAVIEDGRIVGFDDHANLLELCQPYIELFKEQYSYSEVIAHA